MCRGSLSVLAVVIQEEKKSCAQWKSLWNRCTRTIWKASLSFHYS